MSKLNPRFEPLARGMLDEGIVRFGGPFRLKSGRDSVVYVDLRSMISHPALFTEAVDAYSEILVASGMLTRPKGGMRYIAGIPEAALGYAGAVAYKLGAPLLQRRVLSKEHGIKANILGDFPTDTEVVLLDDVVTSAGSKLEEADRLAKQSAGQLVVRGVAVLVDRQQGGQSELQSHGLGLASVMTLDQIATYALEQRLAGMTQPLYDNIMGELTQS